MHPRTTSVYSRPGSRVRLSAKKLFFSVNEIATALHNKFASPTIMSKKKEGTRMKVMQTLLSIVIICCMVAGTLLVGGCQQTEAHAQWAAYAFDQTTTPKEGGPGIISTFTLEETINISGTPSLDGVWELKIDGEYLGKKLTDLSTVKHDTSSGELVATEISSQVECHEVKHTIYDIVDPNKSHPNEAEATLYIPTGDIATTATYYWIYPLAEYSDTDGTTGVWSYIVTDEMQTEKNANPDISYWPYTEGDFQSFDKWVFQGMYGTGWKAFKGFAERGGSKRLKDGNISFTLGNWSYDYSIEATTTNIEAYTFDAWDVSAEVGFQGNTLSYEGTFVEDLPVPTYLKVSLDIGDGNGTFTYNMTDLELA